MSPETRKARVDPYLRIDKQVAGIPVPFSGQAPEMGVPFTRRLRTFPTVALEVFTLPLEGQDSLPMDVEITVVGYAAVNYQVKSALGDVGEEQTRHCGDINRDAVLARAGLRLSDLYFEELEADV